MNTVKVSGLHPRRVVDRAEIERLRRFQMNRYFESGLLSDPPRHLPDDPSVPYSTYFGVYRGDEIQATARIVKAPSGPPMFEYHQLYPDAEKRLIDGAGEVAEVSRLAVDRDTPHYGALALLSREFFRYGLLHQDGLLLVASVEKPLVRILNRLLGVPVEIIGPQIDHYGNFNGETLPILIDTVRCLEVFKSQSSRQWEFFTEGLVLDLTDQHTNL